MTSIAHTSFNALRSGNSLFGQMLASSHSPKYKVVMNGKTLYEGYFQKTALKTWQDNRGSKFSSSK